MIEAPLQLRFAPRVLRETAAWYLAGNPAGWLDEISAWNIAHGSIRLLPTPRSASDQTTVGVLITSSEGSPSAWGASRRCVPFGRIGSRLFLPVDGWLDPGVSDAELDSLLVARYSYLWHPASGLAAFESSDALLVSDLLKTENRRRLDWGLAQPGVVLSQRLIALTPSHHPTVEDVLEDGRDDINTETDSLSELPPSPKEPTSGAFNSAARQGKRFVANVTRWLTKKVPHTGTQETWVNRLENWAEEQLGGYASGLEAARNKEIERLMHLLETNPDQGLRYALPLAGDAHRGNAPPGDRLRERSTDFHLGRLGGGGTADQWDLPYEHHLRLTARYRELANRELQLGRHRRAAYIFAELLGDFHAAAGALTQGRHWREAAVLYRKRLQRPLDAARCLEQGGLWTEAINIYEELKEHESAGDLHAKLEQVESASRQYRLAVEKHRARGDLLAAAGLLEKKLDATDEAIEALSSGWPHSPQSSRCLRELFALFARSGRHDATRKWIEGFRVPQQQNELDLTEILADTATGYSDRVTQEQAADCARALASRQLSNASKLDTTRLLNAVARLEPKDRLLGRDCRRFQSQSPANNALPPPKTRNTVAPQVVHSFSIPVAKQQWETAVSSGESIYVAGSAGSNLAVARCSWGAPDGLASWRTLTQGPIILAANPFKEDFVLAHGIGNDPQPEQDTPFDPSDACPALTRVGAIRGMSSKVLGAARTSHGVTWLFEDRGPGFALIAVGPNGELISTEHVDLLELASNDEENLVALPAPLHARGDRVYLAIGNRMLIYDKAKPVDEIRFPQQIKSLAGSAPNTRIRIVATFERGGAILWDDGGHQQFGFAEEMHAPVACINRAGFLIAASRGKCQVYSTSERAMKLVSEFAIERTQPIAVLAAPIAGRFGIVYESGKIVVYEMPD